MTKTAGNKVTIYWNMEECPCRLCKDRHAECHGSCEKYGAWRKQLDEENEKRQKKDYLEGIGVIRPTTKTGILKYRRKVK